MSRISGFRKRKPRTRFGSHFCSFKFRKKLFSQHKLTAAKWYDSWAAHLELVASRTYFKLNWRRRLMWPARSFREKILIRADFWRCLCFFRTIGLAILNLQASNSWKKNSNCFRMTRETARVVIGYEKRRKIDSAISWKAEVKLGCDRWSTAWQLHLHTA